MVPALEPRVTALADGETIPLGKVTVQAWGTPGHARYHHAFVIGDVCFSEGVAGVRLEGSGCLSVIHRAAAV